ncbi:hypothetical protein, partial [Enterovirga sp.]|uniref:hypothetical protein n=1 Tax=Enterovirga sp. TaxID=2026350 RepID=UPI0026303E3B
LWDAREPDQRALGPGPQVAELRRLLQGTPGEVFWAGGDIEPWFWAGRPAFASLLQKGPALFSRPLALEWKSRVDALLAAGLLRPADLRGWDRDAHQPEDVVLSAGAVTAFCGDARRPAAIVTPGDQRAAAPEGYPARLWTSPAPSGRLTLVDGRFRWRVDTAFTVILCRPPA